MFKKFSFVKKRINQKYSLLIFKSQHIPEITNFVAKIYYEQNHYDFNYSYEQLVLEMCQIDQQLSPKTNIFCIVNEREELCCTGRLVEKFNYLPFEKEFNINLDFLKDTKQNIYEFSRFASNGKIPFRIIEKMLRAIFETLDFKNSLVVASLDKRVFDKFMKIKYPIYELGLPLHYLGSLTIPIGIKLSELPIGEKCLNQP